MSSLPSGDSEFTEVRYVEVPTIEYKEIYVPKIQIVEIEKRVPKVEIIEVEKEVDAVEIHHVTREVDKVIEQEIVKQIPKREIVEVPIEVVKQVPRIQTVIREETVNIPGEIIEVPRTVTLEHRVPVPVYHDRTREAVVAQTLQPIIRQVPATVDVATVDYDPVLCKIIIPIPKPIASPIFWGGKMEDRFRYVAVPPRQYNGLVQNFNRHLPQRGVEDLFVRNTAGQPIPPIGELQSIVSPLGFVEGPKPPTPYILSPDVTAVTTSQMGAQSSTPPRTSPVSHRSNSGLSAMTPSVHKGPKPTMEKHWHTPTGSWLGQVMLDFARDADADRYYREHHEYFLQAMQTPHRQTTQTRSATASGQRSSKRRT